MSTQPQHLTESRQQPGSASATERIHHSDLTAFAKRVAESIEGDCDFTDAGVAMYTSDASNYRQIPLGVVYPRTRSDITTITALCREQQLKVLMRGGGTSQNGQCVNEAVILDCSRYLTRVLSIDAAARTAIIEPGIVCDALKEHAEQQGLTFGPDPATHSRCTLGGMIGNNSCGPRSMLAGKTVENVVSLDILTADGTEFSVGPTTDEELETIILKNDEQGRIYRELKAIRDDYADLIRERFPTIKRRVSGYNLDQLLPENGFNVARALVGSEGTCVSILQAKVRLIENPIHRQLFVLGFDTIFIAGDAVPEIMPFSPIAMEGLDWTIIGGLIDRKLRMEEIALLPDGKAWLLVELSAENEDSLAEHANAFHTAMNNSHRVLSVSRIPAEETARIWSIREQGASATPMSLHPDDPDPIVGWEDTAVDPMQLGDYLREFQALVDKFEYTTSLYGHFGDGCIHARITFDTRSPEGVVKFREFSRELAATVVKYGGSLSGEHGDGQAKAEFLPIMFGEELMQAFERFKRVWDPDNRMNPGKLINPYRMDENLRFGPDYKTPVVTSTLSFVEAPGGLGRASERCIGMGKCRAHEGAMCPSYQVTREERYSTRGRAHLLHELLRGEILRDGWQDENIADSLEHCLSCKACKTECPTQVDIAAYKAEFMYRHYQNRSRPWSHHFLGQITRWLPMLSRMAPVVNLMQASPARTLINRSLGLAPDKRLPGLAPKAFTSRAAKTCIEQDEDFFWFGASYSPPVILWADSFNNYYRPHLLQSTVNVLTTAGFRVGVARSRFCCGRPLYELGLLDQAQAQLQAILDRFHTRLPVKAAVVVLEPACLSVFHDELQRLMPDDPRAGALRERVGTLGDFLMDQAISPKRQLGHGILHLHCHHKSLSYTAAEKNWLSGCFETLSEPEAGCCGMAGSFGLKARTRSIALALFQRKLAPALENARADALVVTNGFSCAEQIGGESGRAVLHPVEVMERCL
ncbi:MAG: FAD-binding oxidoreductase [Gammaproteobacteria bacterium]|nr:FAD-binding oxidoreductase [Gammaproteobacteria bacterium]